MYRTNVVYIVEAIGTAVGASVFFIVCIILTAVITCACIRSVISTDFSKGFIKIRYDTRYYFNVRSKADMSQLNLPHGTDN